MTTDGQAPEKNVIYLDEGERINKTTCPECQGWISSFPDIKSIRTSDGGAMTVYQWECHGCKTIFFQTLK